jgi:hypothetical protein
MFVRAETPLRFGRANSNAVALLSDGLLSGLSVAVMFPRRNYSSSQPDLGMKTGPRGEPYQ